MGLTGNTTVDDIAGKLGGYLPGGAIRLGSTFLVGIKPGGSPLADWRTKFDASPPGCG